VWTGRTLDDELSLRSTLHAGWVLATAGALEHLEMPPDTENAMKFRVTILLVIGISPRLLIN